MAVRDIVRLGDPVLRKEAGPVAVFDRALRSLIRDMFETMYEAEGIGLAAPQIGIAQRVMVVDLRRDGDDEAPRLALVNPRVSWFSDETERQAEGCLSIPGIEEIVERPKTVKVEGFDPEGRPLIVDAADLFARALQHEIDHLDGVLFLDRVTPLKRRLAMKKWQKLLAEESA